MKGLIIVILFVIFPIIFLVRGGCTDDKKLCVNEICKMYEPYGIFDMNIEDENIRYKTSIGNIVIGVIFIETVYVPIVLWGWYLWEPVRVK